ncbi:hypothetical protein D3C79_652850 [compost metagenome]
MSEAGCQHAHFVAAVDVDRVGQIACGDQFDVLNHTVEWAHQNMMDAEPNHGDHRNHQDQHHDQRPNGKFERAVAIFDRDLV